MLHCAHRGTCTLVDKGALMPLLVSLAWPYLLSKVGPFFMT